jgi:hypothetical protein
MLRRLLQIEATPGAGQDRRFIVDPQGGRLVLDASGGPGGDGGDGGDAGQGTNQAYGGAGGAGGRGDDGMSGTGTSSAGVVETIIVSALIGALISTLTPQGSALMPRGDRQAGADEPPVSMRIEPVPAAPTGSPVQPTMPLRQLAEVEAEQAFERYQAAGKTNGPRATVIALLCEAAGKGHRGARYKLAQLHRPWNNDWYRFEPDNRLAYLWYTLAGETGTRESATAEITSAELREAKRLVREWQPGQCPSP